MTTALGPFIPATCASDTLIKTGNGILHTITLSSDAAATAGTLVLRDGTDANGTAMMTFTFIAAYYPPTTHLLDIEFNVGLFLDFTTTADVTANVAYK